MSTGSPGHHGRVLGKASPKKAPTPSGHSSPRASQSRESLSGQKQQQQQALNCPICNMEMVSLSQLNRHLDDDHNEAPNVPITTDDDLKSWFRKRVVDKAKRLQPVQAIHHTLRGVDVFERNGTIHNSPSSSKLQTVSASVSPSSSKSNLAAAVSNNARKERSESLSSDYAQRFESEITKTHWQPETSHDVCSQPGCGRGLNARNGKVHCRCCGKLYCEAHSMYQMKLSLSANHEPVHGCWCRVCKSCYDSRPGYTDTTGAVRDETKFFRERRAAVLDRKYLELNMLDRRLVTLSQILVEYKIKTTRKGFGGLLYSAAPSERRELEQCVVSWQADNTVETCPFCRLPFSFSLRKHHCRLCGRVVCGDSSSDCSKIVKIGEDKEDKERLILNGSASLAKSKDNQQQTEFVEEYSSMSVHIRVCKECYRKVFGRRDFRAETGTKLPFIKSYQILLQFERGIIQLLPRYQTLLSELEDPGATIAHQRLAEATRIRRRLIDSFSQYEEAAKRFVAQPNGNSPTIERIQKMVFQNCFDFLQVNMLPLQSLPKLLKSTGSEQSGGSIRASSPSITSERENEKKESVNSLKDDVETVTDENVAQLAQQLIVLEEQQFLVQGMAEDAVKRRKHDDADALNQSLGELTQEISKIKATLNDAGIMG